jgi:hypothetical protein
MKLPCAYHHNKDCLSALALVCSQYLHNKDTPNPSRMNALWSELVDYHNFYLPGVTTNMSEASHWNLSLLPCLVFKKRVCAEKAAPLLYDHVLTPHCCPAHEQDDRFAFVSDESDSDVCSMPAPSNSSSE